MCAARAGEVETVNVLLAKGADMEANTEVKSRPGEALKCNLFNCSHDCSLQCIPGKRKMSLVHRCAALVEV